MCCLRVSSHQRSQLHKPRYSVEFIIKKIIEINVIRTLPTFNAPQISTASTSSLTTTRKLGVWKRSLKIGAIFLSLHPIVVSQNFSSATSLAKLAPINTAHGILRCFVIMCEINSMPPPSATSKPLIRDKPTALALIFPTIWAPKPLINWCGITKMRMSASLAASTTSGTATYQMKQENRILKIPIESQCLLQVTVNFKKIVKQKIMQIYWHKLKCQEKFSRLHNGRFSPNFLYSLFRQANLKIHLIVDWEWPMKSGTGFFIGGGVSPSTFSERFFLEGSWKLRKIIKYLISYQNYANY